MSVFVEACQVAVNDASFPLAIPNPKTRLPSLPDSIFLSPPPPAPDTEAFKLDEYLSKIGLSLKDSRAWQLAKLDADLSFPHAAGTFSCAVRTAITKLDTPKLYAVLQTVLNASLQSTLAAKDYYHRARPFMLNHEPTCAPQDEPRLAKNGSYPSGHNAIGMAWALVLTEISPEYANAILARGQAFGLSRVVCNAHWYSDTVQGRYLGAFTIARLHGEPSFRSALVAARDELGRARAQGRKPTRDCNAEFAGMVEQTRLFQ
jgi:acid phosphatase (class A)